MVPRTEINRVTSLKERNETTTNLSTDLLFTSFLIFWNTSHWLYPIQLDKRDCQYIPLKPFIQGTEKVEIGGWWICRGDMKYIQDSYQDYAISSYRTILPSILCSGKIVNDFKPSCAALFLSLLDIILMIQMPPVKF